VRPPRHTAAIVTLVVQLAIYILCVPPWFIMLMTIWTFGSPETSTRATLFVLGMLLWPVMALIALIVGWRKRTLKAALVAGAVPIAWLLLFTVIAAQW
jgi:hypothetical protein